MTIVVSPDTTSPTHHISLTDGSTTLGLILRAANKIDPRAIERRPRQNGQFSPFTQSDWASGRGIKDAQSDRSRYADGKRVITRHPGTVMLGGQETYSTGYRQAEQYMPGKMTWLSLYAIPYIAYKVTASASGNREAVYLWVRRRGTPGTLTVELCADDSDKPGTVLKSATATAADIPDTISQLYQFSFSSVQAVTSATAYWIKVYSSGGNAASYWGVGVDAAGFPNLTKSSANGTTWVDATYDLYFRLVDDTDQLGGLFFTYKSQLYFVTRPSGAAAPKLYVNGDRGVATGSHTTITLQDTTKTWVTNEWAGAIVYIASGTNSEWSQPYKMVKSNTSNTLTFLGFPKASVSADTVYVILGSNKWTEITTTGLTVLPTSVTTDGDMVYFAQGDSVKIRKMREYLNGTAWTREFADENNYATLLGTYRHPTNGLMIYKANNFGNDGLPSFAQAKPEATWWARLKFPFLIDNCDQTTGWTVGANTTIATDSGVYKTGTKSLKIVKSASSPTTTPFAYRGFTQYSIDAYKMRAIRFWIFVSNAYLADGDIKVRFSQLTDCSTALQPDVNVPTVTADTWTQVTIPYNDTANGMKYMTSFGLISANNYTLYIDGMELVPAGSEVPLGNPGERITGTTTYGDPETPWIFRAQSAGAVEDGVFNPIPLKEMSQAENIHNGMGNVVHNVYLYFSFLHGLERFYRNNLDDVGPNRDEGLPDGRRGFITSMKGYIGRFFYNYDCLDGYNAIFESTAGADHHEIYRCDTPGKRIRNLFIQVVPGDAADRLWFTEGDDIAWIPLPGNTLKEDTDDTFFVTHEGVLETGWIYGAEADSVKLFSSLKLFTENVTANRYIEWDYCTDDNTAWIPSTTSFTSVPVQEIDLNISAKRVKLRFRLQTNDNTETPIIRTMVLYSTTRPAIRYTYTLQTQADDAGIDLEGDEDTSLRAATIVSTLDGWCAANTILTMNSVFSTFDNKSVFLEPIVIRPVSFVADESAEKMMLTLNLIEP